jgi:hypothetical protein
MQCVLCTTAVWAPLQLYCTYYTTVLAVYPLQLAAGKPVLVLIGNGSRFLEEFPERPYKQAINKHAGTYGAVGELSHRLGATTGERRRRTEQQLMDNGHWTIRS